MKQTLIWYNLQRDGTGNDGTGNNLAWQNIKKNYLKNEESCKRVFQKCVFEKNVKTTFNSKLKLT